jgi:hypothetical protein
MSNTFEQKTIYVFKSGLGGDGTFLDLVAPVDDCQSVRFKRGTYVPGDFSFTINKNTLYASAFTRGRIVRIGEDNTKCGVIETVKQNIGQEGAASEVITVTGHELTQWFARRVVIPPTGSDYYNLTGPAETVAKALIQNAMGSLAVANRQVVTMTLVADSARGSSYTCSARYTNLLTVLSDIGLTTNSGIFITLDPVNHKFIVDYLPGLDRTASQTTNPRAIFTTDLETTGAAELTDTEDSYRNMMLVAGQGEGSGRTIVTVPASEPTDLDRREMFVDARDLSTVPDLTARGNQTLAANVFTKFLTADPLAYSQLVYGKDYNVGDKVTFRQFGLSVDVFITSVEETWDPGNYGIKLGFDKQTPTITTQAGAIAGKLTTLQENTGTSIYNTNANGRYLKLADGTLIQWKTGDTTPIGPTNTALGSVWFTGTPVTKTFPIAFQDEPAVTMNVFGSTGGSAMGQLAGVPTTSGFQAYYMASASGSTGYIYSWIAIGRWK